jgi:aromatic-L-amino-acid decarboxylase
LPATVAANWLAAAWDQNACLRILSPVAAQLEDIALGWLLEIFGLPPGSGGAFVTGAQTATFTALAATARGARGMRLECGGARAFRRAAY